MPRIFVEVVVLLNGVLFFRRFSVILPGLVGFKVEFRSGNDLFLAQGNVDVGADLFVIGREVHAKRILVSVAAHERHDRYVLIHACGFGGLTEAYDLADIDLAVIHHQHDVLVFLQGETKQ